MTTVFYVFAALLALACAATLARKVGQRPQARSLIEHRQANLAVLRDQLKEIERDRQAGTLSEADFGQAQTDLRQRVLEESRDLPTDSAPALGDRRLGMLLLFSLPVLALLLYTLLGTPQMLNPASLAQSASQAPVDVPAMVARLEQRLKDNPDDPSAWLMMARSHRYYDRHAEAAQAFGKAMAVVDDDPAALAQYAESLLLSGQGQAGGLPEELVARSLHLNPSEPLGLMLAGAAALHREQYSQAINHWERLLAQFPADSKSALMVEQGLKLARQGQLKAAGAAAKP